jgi:hypothetical protein
LKKTKQIQIRVPNEQLYQSKIGAKVAKLLATAVSRGVHIF